MSEKPQEWGVIVPMTWDCDLSQQHVTGRVEDIVKDQTRVIGYSFLWDNPLKWICTTQVIWEKQWVLQIKITSPEWEETTTSISSVWYTKMLEKKVKI